MHLKKVSTINYSYFGIFPECCIKLDLDIKLAFHSSCMHASLLQRMDRVCTCMSARSIVQSRSLSWASLFKFPYVAISVWMWRVPYRLGCLIWSSVGGTLGKDFRLFRKQSLSEESVCLGFNIKNPLPVHSLLPECGYNKSCLKHLPLWLSHQDWPQFGAWSKDKSFLP